MAHAVSVARIGQRFPAQRHGLVKEAASHGFGVLGPRGPSRNRVVEKHDPLTRVEKRTEILLQLSGRFVKNGRRTRTKLDARHVVEHEAVEIAGEFGSEEALGGRVFDIRPFDLVISFEDGEEGIARPMTDLELPLDIRAVRDLTVGEQVSIRGALFTARDEALQHLYEGGTLPFEELLGLSAGVQVVGD